MYEGNDTKWILGLLGVLLTAMGIYGMIEVNGKEVVHESPHPPNPYFFPVIFIVIGLLFLALINLKKKNKH